MTSRTTDDYEAMAKAGVAAIVEPAFWLGQPRPHVGTFEDYFCSLLGWERFRASQFGIHHYCTMGLNPKEANDERLAPGVADDWVFMRLTSPRCRRIWRSMAIELVRHRRGLYSRRERGAQRRLARARGCVTRY